MCFFSQCIKHCPIQPQYFQEKKLSAFQHSCWSMLACCGHTLHLCIFLKKRRQKWILPCCKVHGVLEAVKGWASLNDISLQFMKGQICNSLLCQCFSKWKIGHYVMCEDHFTLIITSRICYFTFQRVKINRHDTWKKRVQYILKKHKRD